MTRGVIPGHDVAEGFRPKVYMFVGRLALFSFCVLSILSTSFAEDFELPEMPPPAPKSSSSATLSSAALSSSAAVPAPSSATLSNPATSSASEEIDVPINFKPIESTSVAEVPKVAPSGDTLAKIQREKIPANLNRPLRVGVYTDVKELYLLRGGEEVHVTLDKNRLKFQGKGGSFTAESKEIFSEGKCVSIATTKKQLPTSCFPGDFVISYNKGRINAINIVDMEEYLRGVIPYEIGQLDSSRFNALKAQAVAARTYAYKHFGSRESLGFDVFADTKDQVYKGLQSATALTDAAVKETRGEVMTYKGEFITAYYHSTCGGMSETMDTWEKPNLPYLKTKTDLRKDGTPWCNESSYSKWERSFSEEELVKLFVQNANEAKAKVSTFKKIKDIAIKDTLPSGRILTLIVTTDKESFQVRGDKTRWLFKKNGTILPSSFFKVSKEKDQWVIKGKGFGHGVGMCQMGVRARAQAGQSYVEILSHYYPGITLERFER